MSLLYENEMARLSLDPAVPCLVFEWMGKIDSRNQFRDTMAHWLSALYTLRTRIGAGLPLGVLVNNANAQPIDAADQEWMAEHITPRQLEAGLSFVAIVDGRTPVSHSNVSGWRMRVALLHQPLVTEVFADVSSARAWLHEAVTGER